MMTCFIVGYGLLASTLVCTVIVGLILPFLAQSRVVPYLAERIHHGADEDIPPLEHINLWSYSTTKPVGFARAIFCELQGWVDRKLLIEHRVALHPWVMHIGMPILAGLHVCLFPSLMK